MLSSAKNLNDFDDKSLIKNNGIATDSSSNILQNTNTSNTVTIADHSDDSMDIDNTYKHSNFSEIENYSNMADGSNCTAQSSTVNNVAVPTANYYQSLDIDDPNISIRKRKSDPNSEMTSSSTNKSSTNNVVMDQNNTHQIAVIEKQIFDLQTAYTEQLEVLKSQLNSINNADIPNSPVSKKIKSLDKVSSKKVLQNSSFNDNNSSSVLMHKNTHTKKNINDKTSANTNTRITDNNGASKHHKDNLGNGSDDKDRSNSSKSNKIPPIIIYDLNIKSFRSIIKEFIPLDNFLIKSNNGNVSHIFAKDFTSHSKIKEVLKEYDKQFFSHTPGFLKCKNVVLKNLDNTFEEEDIREALNNLNISDCKIVDVFKIKTRASETNNSLNLWLISLSNDSNLKSLYNIRFLLNTRISFEKYINKKVIQCKKCQRFDHIAKNCNMNFKCVKCSDSHIPGNCPLDNDPEANNKLKCANCQMSHTANYRGCTKYKDVLKKRIKHTENVISNGNSIINQTNSLVKKNISFAEALKTSSDNSTSQKYNNTSSNDDFNFLNKECSSLFNKNFFDLFSEIQEFIPKYNQISNINEKKLFIVQFLFELCSK